MAVLLIGDNEFNGRIVCDGNIDTECTEFIDHGDGVEVIHLYVSSGYISSSLLQLYSRPLDFPEEWTLIFETNMGGYNDNVWIGLTLQGDNTEYKATYKGLTKYYTLNYPCVPNWQCELPLNGYEADGCGDRRYNEACIDPCQGVTCFDICVGTDLYSQKCDPVTGECIIDQLIEENLPACGYDPCEEVVCEDFCDGTTRYYSGICDPDIGECVYTEEINSELCGYVPPEEPEEPLKYLLYGGLGLAALFGLKKLNKK